MYIDLNPTTSAHWTYQIFVMGHDPSDRRPIPDHERDYSHITVNPIDNAANLSSEYIRSLENKDGKDRHFDFVYIDGSHIAKDVLTDTCIAWQLLKKDGIMVFDDYGWGNPRDALHRPKLAIDAFTNIFAEEVVPIHTHYQMIVRKSV